MPLAGKTPVTVKGAEQTADFDCTNPYFQLDLSAKLHQLHNRELVFGQPKSKKGRRLVALSPSLALLLRDRNAM